MAAVLVFSIAVIFLAPCAFVWSLNGGAHDLTIVALGSTVGTAGALLWSLRSPARTSLPAAHRGDTARHSRPDNSPTPWRALRTALGPPYAPAAWQLRLMQLVTLCAVVVGAPRLVEIFRGSLSARAFTMALHFAQFAILLPAVALCWLWPLTKVIGLFSGQGGALTELALLPGLGSPQQQRRRLFLVALCAPAGALIALLITAMGIAKLEHLRVPFPPIDDDLLPHSNDHTADSGRPSCEAGAAQPLVRALLIFTQTWTFAVIVWTGSWDVLIQITPRWLIVAVVLGALCFVAGMTLYSLRKLALRPHPFVEVSG